MAVDHKLFLSSRIASFCRFSNSLAPVLLIAIAPLAVGQQAAPGDVEKTTTPAAEERIVEIQPAPEYFPIPSAIEQRIESTLEKRASIECVETPLQDFLAELADEHGILIMLDRPALRTANVDVDVPITVSLSDIRLQSILNYSLGELGLTWVVRDDMLLVTSQASQANEGILRCYPVSDLCEDVRGMTWLNQIVQMTALQSSIPSRNSGNVMMHTQPQAFVDRTSTVQVLANLDFFLFRQPERFRLV